GRGPGRRQHAPEVHVLLPESAHRPRLQRPGHPRSPGPRVGEPGVSVRKARGLRGGTERSGARCYVQPRPSSRGPSVSEAALSDGDPPSGGVTASCTPTRIVSVTVGLPAVMARRSPGTLMLY